MRIHDPLTEGEEPYNLVPLTDMVFNLLIFFLCATTFVQIEKDMALQLPQARATAMANAATANQLIINIRQDGSTIISGTTYDQAGLARRVAEAVAGRKDQTVIIRADERCVVKYFANVARICKSAGVHEAKLVYLEQGE